MQNTEKRMKKKAIKGLFLAKVRSNIRTGHCFYKIELEFEGTAAEIYAKAQPGQFGQIDLSRTALPADNLIAKDLKDSSVRDIILRRPFSFSNVQTRGDKTIVQILYCVVGPASLRMTTLKAGDTISIIGPLGKGFWMPQGKKIALLAAGGMGSPQCSFWQIVSLKKILT